MCPSAKPGNAVHAVRILCDGSSRGPSLEVSCTAYLVFGLTAGEIEFYQHVAWICLHGVISGKGVYVARFFTDTLIRQSAIGGPFL